MTDTLANTNIDNTIQRMYIENQNLESILNNANIDLNILLPSKNDSVYKAPEGAIPGYHYLEIVFFDLLAIGYSPTEGLQVTIIS
ncbi:hypothetical protein RLOatenuis_4540 [Rickettsiales bacterium]|nr:hypothetical protein RLOatenuis_4540 [Rickettsiales bacterium]